MDLHTIVSQIKNYYSEYGEVPSIVKFRKFFDVSTRQINKHGWTNLVKMAGLEPNKSSQQKEPVTLEARKAKILIFDIETSPLRAYVYGLFDQNIGINQIDKEWHLLSYAAKFLGEDEFFYKDQRDEEDVENDKILCQSLRDLIVSADIVLGHNSDSFDLKKLNARLIKHDILPIPEMQTIDTLKIARRFFKFTSNKLDYIAKFLDVGGKIHSKKFVGFDLWKAALEKNMEAYEEMEIYNKQDVVITEKVFLKLVTYDTKLNLHTYTQSNACICGCVEFNKDGVRYTSAGIFQRYKCRACGKYYRSKDNLLPKETRKELFK